jgi:predicted S18 family serine protease
VIHRRAIGAPCGVFYAPLKKGNRIMFKNLLTLALVAASVFVGAASATSYSGSLGANAWTGSVNGHSSSVSTGGSSSQTEVKGNGYAANSTVNAGGGQSSAYGSFSGNGTVTGSDIKSYSTGVSNQAVTGGGKGFSSGAVGTDVNAGAWGTFVNHGAGFGGFAGFGR